MNIASTKDAIQSATNPLLKRGGASSSDLLNTIFSRATTDIVNLNAKVQDLDRKRQLLSSLLTLQAAGIQAITSHIEGLIPAAVPGKGLADFYGTDYQGAGNTAFWDTSYGQATLPISSVVTKMSATDSQGNLWVPEDARLRYYIGATWTNGVFPPDDGYYSSLEDYLGIGDRADSFFLGEATTGPAYVYLKADLPQSLNTNTLTNRLTFSILPSFANTLVAAYIRNTAGAWTQLDVSYLPNISGSEVTFLGPTRMYFSPTEITSVCLVIAVNGLWGVSNFGVDLVAFQPSANLVVDFAPYSPPGPIKTVTLLGANAGVLNQYPQTIQGTKVTIPLTQTNLYSSPVVTAVTATW